MRYLKKKHVFLNIHGGNISHLRVDIAAMKVLGSEDKPPVAEDKPPVAEDKPPVNSNL